MGTARSIGVLTSNFFGWSPIKRIANSFDLKSRQKECSGLPIAKFRGFFLVGAVCAKAANRTLFRPSPPDHSIHLGRFLDRRSSPNLIIPI